MAFVERVLPQLPLSRFLIRSGYLPRSPRFAAIHAFALLVLWGVYPGRGTAAPHPRFAWARTVYPRCKRNAKSPQAPRFAAVAGFVDQDTSRSVLIRRAATTDRAARAIHARQLVTSSPRFLRARERFSRPARSVPAASLQRPFGEGIGEASARRNTRRFAGWSCAVLSQPHRNDHHLRGACAPPRTATRGNVPMEGATPANGGKPNAADSGQTRLAPNRRARFWAAQAARVAPVSREVR